MRRTRMLLAALILTLAPAALADENWPSFRGGPAAGVARDKRLPDTWDMTRNIAWKVEVPGHGWSCPVVWGDKVFLTSVINEGKSEEPRKGLYFGGERLKPSADVHRWIVWCLDWKSGKVLWERQAHKGVPESTLHIKNTYASETPVTDGERLYA